MISPIVTERMRKVITLLKLARYLPIVVIVINMTVAYMMLPKTLLNISQSLNSVNYVLVIAAIVVLLLALVCFTFINNSVKLYCKSNDIIKSYISNPNLKLDYINLAQKERILIFSIYKYKSYFLIIQVMIIFIIELGLISAIIAKNAANLYSYALIAFLAFKIFQPKLQFLIQKLNRKVYLHMS